MATPRLKAAPKGPGRIGSGRVRRPGREPDEGETARLMAAVAPENGA